MIRRRIIGVYLILCSVFLYPVISSAQQNMNEVAGGNGTTPVNDIFYKYDVQVGGEITYPLTDPAMVKTFVGIYSVNASFDFSILKRLYVGAEVFNDQFAIAANPLYFTLNPRMFNYMGGLRIGYHSSNDKSNDFLFNASFTGGMSHIVFTNSLIPAAPVDRPFGALYIMESYRFTEQCWIGLDISYTYLNYTFNPDYLGIQNSGLTFYPSDSRGNVGFIGWGFQVFYALSKGKN
jgi:hypothetical protein